MTLSFAMAGRVSDCVQLNYRTPADSVRAMLPDGLELITRGPWAFWNVMCCRIEKVRPSGVPAFCGLTYHHIAYRLRVQAMNDRAEIVRGLYYVRSDADAKVVSLLGNRLSDFQLHPASITLQASDCAVRYTVDQTASGQGDLDLEVAHAPAQISNGSCFPTLADARQFCRYTPNGLSVVEPRGQRHLRLTRVMRGERAWCETPLMIRRARLAYFDMLDQAEHAQLEWACRLGPMDYRWRVGETMALLQQPMAMQRDIRVAG